MEDNFDFQGAVDKIKEMFSGDDGQTKLQGIMDMFSDGSGDKGNNNSDAADDSSGGFDFDPEMFFKLQKIMSALKGGKSNEKARLLMSLKPFLHENRRDKVDQAVKLMNMSKILSVMKETDSKGV